jgi:hypothetical protein
MMGSFTVKAAALLLAAAGAVLGAPVLEARAKSPITYLGNQGPILCKFHFKREWSEE